VRRARPRLTRRRPGVLAATAAPAPLLIRACLPLSPGRHAPPQRRHASAGSRPAALP